MLQRMSMWNGLSAEIRRWRIFARFAQIKCGKPLGDLHYLFSALLAKENRIMTNPIKDSAWWLEHHFENWARWMRGDELPDSLPKRAAGRLENFTTMYGDSEEAYDRMDKTLAEATNAAIEGLPSPAEQNALYAHYGVSGMVFKFNREPFEVVLLTAKRNVAGSLRRRGVWMGE